MKKVVPILLLIGVALCALIGSLGYKAYKKYSPTKEPANLEEFYQASGSQSAIFLNDELQEAKGLSQGGHIYFPILWVNQNLNERFYWDSNEWLLIYALPEEILRMDAATRGASGAPLVVIQNQEAYLSDELLLQHTNVRIQSFSGEVIRTFVDSKWEAEEWRTMKGGGTVREKGGIKSLVVAKEPEGAKAKVIDSMERWAKVRTEDGHIGYVENRKLGEKEERVYDSAYQAPVYRNISSDQKICLAWHQVTSPEGNKSIQKLLQNTKGVNVISPTWYALTDNDGNYNSFADRSYVDYLHDQGIQVWALIDNFSSNVQTEVLLSKTATRQKLIERLMQEVDTYNLDGLNLDFESLKESAGSHYVQFIRELSVSCRKKQIVLSVDNHVPASFNAFYNRKEQGIVADYVIIMGYDEHYSGGDAGPVASMPYVKKGIEDTLKEVPKEKVINAIPLYTRVWKENKDGETSSDALGISDAKAWVNSNRVALQWQEDNGLYYGQIPGEEERKEIWLEEEKSIGLKMNLIRDYDLAGVACWKLGFEPAAIWDIVKVNE